MNTVDPLLEGTVAEGAVEGKGDDDEVDKEMDDEATEVAVDLAALVSVDDKEVAIVEVDETAGEVPDVDHF